MNSREVRRIREVYRGYRMSGRVRDYWSLAHPGNRAMLLDRRQQVKKLLGAHGLLPLGERRVLDVGCGTGGELAWLLELGAQPGSLYGVDLLEERARAAAQNCPAAHLACSNAEQLPFVDGSFDLVLLYTVFSSILDDAMASNIAREVGRVLKEGGAVLWYDFRFQSPGNSHVRAMTRERALACFPHWTADLRRVTLAPPIGRRLGFLTPVLYPLLSAIPQLRTHYLGLIFKPPSGGGPPRPVFTTEDTERTEK